MRELNRYRDIAPVVSSTGGFYNPDQETSKAGEFYLSLNGVPRSIEISYNGSIRVIKNPNLSKVISLMHNSQTGKLFFNSKSPVEYIEEKIFTFSGDIKQLNYVKIYNWAGITISSSIVNYDQKYIPLNKSEINFEDDSIVIRDIEKKKRKTFRFVKPRGSSNIKNNMTTQEETLKLPKSYVRNKAVVTAFADNEGNEISTRSIRGQYCHNCYFLKGSNYCEKWDAKISRSGWCASWKKKEGVK